jgi:hypothetical protein
MSDGAIHAACMHDFSKYRGNCETDRRAIEAIGSPLAGSNRPLIITAGTALIQEHVAIEDDVPELGSVSRPASRPRHGASTGGRPLEDRTGAPGPLPLSGTSYSHLAETMQADVAARLDVAFQVVKTPQKGE